MARKGYMSRAKRAAAAVAPMDSAASMIRELEPPEEGIDDPKFQSQVEDAVSAAGTDAESAKDGLDELYEELETWYDNLNEGLQAGSTGQRLEEAKDALDTAKDACDSAADVCNGFTYEGHTEWSGDLEEALSEIADALDEAVSEAESVDFPGMYGR